MLKTIGFLLVPFPVYCVPVMWIRIDFILIQVNKITKFSKHLIIFKSKKRYELSEEVAVSKHQHLLFLLGSELKNIISSENFLLLVKLCFSLHFIRDFILLDPDPDPHDCCVHCTPNKVTCPILPSLALFPDIFRI